MFPERPQVNGHWIESLHFRLHIILLDLQYCLKKPNYLSQIFIYIHIKMLNIFIHIIDFKPQIGKNIFMS